MSKGLGWVQLRILRYLGEMGAEDMAMPLTPLQAARRVYGDNPTRSQIGSARRALAELVESGEIALVVDFHPTTFRAFRCYAITRRW